MPGFNRLDNDNCKTRRESFKFGDLVRLILETIRLVEDRKLVKCAPGTISSHITESVGKFIWSIKQPASQLTHWGQVRHIRIGNLTIIGSDNCLSPDWHKAITQTNAEILLIGPIRRLRNGDQFVSASIISQIVLAYFANLYNSSVFYMHCVDRNPCTSLPRRSNMTKYWGGGY